MSAIPPPGSYERDGKIYDGADRLIEPFEGHWRVVLNEDRTGWWRFHDHYDGRLLR
jgi:hypothetical protein